MLPPGILWALRKYYIKTLLKTKYKVFTKTFMGMKVTIWLDKDYRY